MIVPEYVLIMEHAQFAKEKDLKFAVIVKELGREDNYNQFFILYLTDTKTLLKISKIVFCFIFKRY